MNLHEVPRPQSELVAFLRAHYGNEYEWRHPDPLTLEFRYMGGPWTSDSDGIEYYTDAMRADRERHREPA